jgi:hypothetical protein
MDQGQHPSAREGAERRVRSCGLTRNWIWTVTGKRDGEAKDRKVRADVIGGLLIRYSTSNRKLALRDS